MTKDWEDTDADQSSELLGLLAEPEWAEDYVDAAEAAQRASAAGAAGSATQEASGEDDDLFADALSSLSSNGRHAGLMMLCTYLHAIIVRNAAEVMLAEGIDALPEYGSVWVAPSFGWLVPRIDVGRKDRGPRGSRLRLPVRLEWPHVVEVIPESAVHTPVGFSWTTTSMGHTGQGQVAVTLTPGYDTWETAESEAGIPVQAYGPLLSRSEMWNALSNLVAEGKVSQWELVTSMERRVMQALNRSHTSMRLEMKANTGSDAPLVDATKMEKICNTFLFGEGDHPGKLLQIVNRLCDPVTLTKVDPAKYIEVALKRDTKEAIRQEIGDPRIGAKVRAFQRSLQAPDIDTLVSEFKKMYPTSYLSHDRARAALDVGPDLMAEVFPLLPGGGDEADDDPFDPSGLYPDFDDPMAGPAADTA